MSQATLPESATEKRLWKFLGLALLALFALWQIIPWHPRMPSDRLDSCWATGLHIKFLTRYDCGQSAFTFGPWGFIFAGYNPHTYPLVIAAWLVISAALFCGAREIAARMTTVRPIAILWIIALFAVIGCTGQSWRGSLSDPFPPDIKLFALIAMLAALRFHIARPQRSFPIALLTIAIALASLVKFSSFVLAAIVIMLTLIDDLSHRRLPWIAGLFVASLIAFWLIAGQSLASIPSYLKLSAEIASGYTEAMSIWTEGEMQKLMFFWMCAAMLIFLIVLSRRSFTNILGATSGAAILFMTYKAGFVRCDGLHEPAAVITLLATALIYMAALQPTPKPGLCSKFWFTTVAGSIALVIFSIKPDFKFQNLTWRSAPTADFQTALANICRENPLPEISGSVDAYPWGESILLAHNLSWAPRPIPQSYAAFSPHLLKLNADHLLGPDSPGTILFNVQALGGSYLAQQDALSWPQLLTRYDITDARWNYLILRRAATPRTFSFEAIESRTGSWSEPIEVPSIDAGPVWMTIDIHPTPSKRLFDLLYKPPIVSIELEDQAGNKTRVRLIPSEARAGSLVSPNIQNRQAFAALASIDWRSLLASEQIKSFTLFQEPENSSAYESTFTVTFSRLHFPHQDLSKVPGFNPTAWSMSDIEKPK